MFGRRAADPQRLTWSARWAQARPGLQALGIDPDLPPAKLQARLMRTDRMIDGTLVVGGRVELLGDNQKIDKAKDLSPQRQARLDAVARGLAGVLTSGVMLSPDVESGIEMCARSTHCYKTCLSWHTGHNQGGGAQRARVRKTLFWWLFPDVFLQGLQAELGLLKYTALSEGRLPAVRFNVGSDIPWERHPELFEGGVPAYDYTKLPRRLRNPGANYHLTYSLSEAEGSLAEALDWLRHGGNVAVVIGPTIPMQVYAELAEIDRQMQILRGAGQVETPLWIRLRNQRGKLFAPGKFNGASIRAAQAVLDRGELWGFPVLDGDQDDARFLDEPGAWVVLAAKNSAVFDQSGFVVRVHPDGTPVLSAREQQAREVPWTDLKRAKADFRQYLSPVARMSDEVAPQFIDIGAFERFGEGKRGRRATSCFTLPAPYRVDPWGNAI